jgi:hypothetical protein
MRVSRGFTTFCVCLSDTTRDDPASAGMAGLRHKQRHRAVDPLWFHPAGSPSPPVRQRGKAAPFRLDSQIPDLRNVSCKLIPEQKRQAVEEVGIRGLTAPYQILHFHFQRNCDPLQHP